MRVLFLGGFLETVMAVGAWKMDMERVEIGSVVYLAHWMPALVIFKPRFLPPPSELRASFETAEISRTFLLRQSDPLNTRFLPSIAAFSQISRFFRPFTMDGLSGAEGFEANLNKLSMADKQELQQFLAQEGQKASIQTSMFAQS